MKAEDYYQQGNAWRKQGDFKRAIDGSFGLLQA